jgi:hypothetical protein
MNNYYRGPERADVVGSEAAALRAALSVLLE